MMPTQICTTYKSHKSKSQRVLEYTRRCAGTNKQFKHKDDRIDYFKKKFTARPITLYINDKHLYYCGIKDCSSKRKTFLTEQLCLTHMVIATESHDTNLIKFHMQNQSDNINEKEIDTEQSLSDSDELKISKDESDSINPHVAQGLEKETPDNYNELTVSQDEIDFVQTEWPINTQQTPCADIPYDPNTLEPLFDSYNCNLDNSNDSLLLNELNTNYRLYDEGYYRHELAHNLQRIGY